MPSRDFPKTTIEGLQIEVCDLEAIVRMLQQRKGDTFPIYNEEHLPRDLLDGQAFLTQQGRFCVKYGNSMFCMPSDDTARLPWPALFTEAKLVGWNPRFMLIEQDESARFSEYGFFNDYSAPHGWNRDYSSVIRISPTENFPVSGGFRAHRFRTSDLESLGFVSYGFIEHSAHGITTYEKTTGGWKWASGAVGGAPTRDWPGSPGPPAIPIPLFNDNLRIYNENTLVAAIDATENFQDVSSAPMTHGIGWSYDGAKLIYFKADHTDDWETSQPLVSNYGNVKMCNANGANIHVIFPNRTTAVIENALGESNCRFNPQSYEVFCLSAVEDSYTLESSLHGILLEEFNTGNDFNQHIGDFSISPDGTKIAVVLNHSLALMNTDGSNFRFFKPKNNGWFNPIFHQIDWAKDGQKIIITRSLNSGTQIFIADPVDRKIRYNQTLPPDFIQDLPGSTIVTPYHGPWWRWHPI